MFQDNQPEQQPVTPEQPAAPQQPAAPAEQQQQGQAPAAAPAKPAAPPEKTTQEERMWAAIGYIAFLGVVTLAIKPKSEFCKHHAAQGLTIFAVWFVSLILLAMPSFIGAIGGLLLLGATGIAVFGIVKAIQSYKMELPVLSSIAKKIPTDSIIGSVTGKTPEAKKPAEGEKKPAESQTPQEQAPQQPQQPSQEEAPKPQEPAQGGQDEGQQTPPPANPPQAQ